MFYKYIQVRLEFPKSCTWVAVTPGTSLSDTLTRDIIPSHFENAHKYRVALLQGCVLDLKILSTLLTIRSRIVVGRCQTSDSPEREDVFGRG